jgi:nucleoside-triphosphatase THEP1
MGMEFATGAMGALLPKLGVLLQKEYHLKKRMKQGIKDLKAELESMHTALVKVSNVPSDQLDPLVRIWANEIRELSYVIEDSLDSFMVHFEDLEPTKPHVSFVGFIRGTRNKITEFKIRHKIANDMKDIESHVRKVKERYDRYKVHDIAANHATTTVIDPRLSAMYNKVSDLVGIDKPMDELMKSLFEGGDVPKRKLKTVSIIGFGGLGKTTLAKAVYDKISKKFDCGVFVPVGQNPDMKKVFGDILHELGLQTYNVSSPMDVRQLINQLQKFLADKRYALSRSMLVNTIFVSPRSNNRYGASVL